jgi:hypothetical protein
VTVVTSGDDSSSVSRAASDRMFSASTTAPTTRVVPAPGARSVTEYRQSCARIGATDDRGATATIPHGSPVRAATASV